MPTVKELIEHLQTLDQDKTIDILYDHFAVLNPIKVLQKNSDGNYMFVAS